MIYIKRGVQINFMCYYICRQLICIFLSGLHNATRRRCLNTEKKKCNDNNVYHSEKV